MERELKEIIEIAEGWSDDVGPTIVHSFERIERLAKKLLESKSTDEALGITADDGQGEVLRRKVDTLAENLGKHIEQHWDADKAFQAIERQLNTHIAGPSHSAPPTFADDPRTKMKLGG